MATSDDVTGDELIQSRRLRAIFDARERVREIEGRIEERKTLEGRPLSETQAKRLLHTAAKQYLREVEPLIHPERQPQADAVETDYWTGHELGSIALPSGKRIEVDSLEDYYELPNPLVHTYREVVEDPPNGYSEEVRQVEVQPPQSMSMNAVRLVNLFCAEAGLEVDLDDDSLSIFGFDEADETEEVEVL